MTRPTKEQLAAMMSVPEMAGKTLVQVMANMSDEDRQQLLVAVIAAAKETGRTSAFVEMRAFCQDQLDA